jgi:hypothetical protein
MESRKDQFARLQLMADGHDAWDLSDNDCARTARAATEAAGRLMAEMEWEVRKHPDAKRMERVLSNSTTAKEPE